MGVTIRQAKEREAGLLTELALRSKSHWPYPKEYLAGSRPVLTITSDFIQNWPVLIAESENQILGFSALLGEENKRLLDHLWVEPGKMGLGVGRRLFDAAVEHARALGWRNFDIIADPYAEPFYLRMGAKRIGEVESKIQKGLFLPLLRYAIAMAGKGDCRG
jgi:GNAT superfamily N-acetyltransferase